MKQARKINTGKPSFDLNVHKRDGKGNIYQEDHYRLTVVHGKKEFERPPGSGFIYDEAGTLIRSPKSEATKVAFDEAPSKVDLSDILVQLEMLKQQNARLEKALSEKPVVGSNEPESEPELPEIHMTANDVVVDDVPVVPASQADNSDELRLIQEATGNMGGLAAQNPKSFNRPNFLKG